jgi:hypothetical protein
MPSLAFEIDEQTEKLKLWIKRKKPGLALVPERGGGTGALPCPSPPAMRKPGQYLLPHRAGK